MNKSKVIIIILIAAVVAACLIYFNAADKKRTAAVIYEPVPGQKNSYFETEGRLAVVNQDGLTVLSRTGSEHNGIVKSYASPAASIRGNNKLLYDRGGTEAVYSRGEKQISLQTDLPIITAKVNSSGYFAIAAMETGYKGKLEVYDEKGSPVYKWQMGSSYVVDMDISSDCKRMAVAALSMTGDTASCRISMIDLDKAELIAESTLDNTLPLSVTFTRQGIADVVTERGVSAFDRSGEQKWSFEFGDKILEDFDIDDGGYGVYKFVGAGNNSILQIYSGTGALCGEYNSETEITAFDNYQGMIAAAEGTKIVILDKNAAVKTTLDASFDLRDAVILDSDTIAAVGGSTVNVIKY